MSNAPLLLPLSKMAPKSKSPLTVIDNLPMKEVTTPSLATSSISSDQRVLSSSVSSLSLDNDPIDRSPVPDPKPFNDTVISNVSEESTETTLADTLNVDLDSVDTSEFRPLVVGHRGAPYKEPENTLEGFETTAEIGCDGVELDVFLLKCGTLIVFHGGGGDENPGCLKDYCGIEGSILDYTAEEARKLPLDPKTKTFRRFSKDKLENATIPTLEEVLEMAKKTGITVKIELKGPNTVEPVLELVDRMDMVDQCAFSSFKHDRVARVRELRPERRPDGIDKYRTGCIFTVPPDNFLEVAKKAGASEVHLRYDTCTKERVEAIHDAGMKSMAWFRNPLTMQTDAKERFADVRNEDEMYPTVMSTGVKEMCVNKPDVLLNIVEENSAKLVSAC